MERKLAAARKKEAEEMAQAQEAIQLLAAADVELRSAEVITKDGRGGPQP